MMLCPETLVCFNILDTAGLVKKLALITSSEDSPEQLIILSELGSKLSITMMETDGKLLNYSYIFQALDIII